MKTVNELRKQIDEYKNLIMQGKCKQHDHEECGLSGRGYKPSYCCDYCPERIVKKQLTKT